MNEWPCSVQRCDNSLRRPKYWRRLITGHWNKPDTYELLVILPLNNHSKWMLTVMLSLTSKWGRYLFHAKTIRDNPVVLKDILWHMKPSNFHKVPVRLIPLTRFGIAPSGNHWLHFPVHLEPKGYYSSADTSDRCLPH